MNKNDLPACILNMRPLEYYTLRGESDHPPARHDHQERHEGALAGELGRGDVVDEQDVRDRRQQQGAGEQPLSIDLTAPPYSEPGEPSDR
jgi:hypothetical protein